MKTSLSWCSALALLFVQAFAVPAVGQTPPKKPTPPVRIDYDTVKRLFGDNPMAPPADNASTPEKIALGKALYQEKSLSKDGTASCASCHDIASYGTDGKTNGRNTPTTLNAFRQFAQFWDGRVATVEEVVVPHAIDATGLGAGGEAELLRKIKAKPELVDAFKKAFAADADPVTANNFKLGLGSFLRTLTTKSKFDAYLDGDQKALTNDEKLGLKTFMDVSCITCHTTRLVGGAMFQKTGLLKPYQTEDTGRAALTKSDADKGFFKVPTLLNVEKTGPYMHDGKITTLEEIVTKMADIQLNRQLKPEEVAAIVTFLKTLTGPLPEMK
jgi:cytochrome c peroxidase